MNDLWLLLHCTREYVLIHMLFISVDIMVAPPRRRGGVCHLTNGVLKALREILEKMIANTSVSCPHVSDLKM